MEMKGEGPKQSKNQSVKDLGFFTCFFCELVIHQFPP